MDGEELRRRRRALGLTQRQLAGRLGVAQQSIARWETGALRIERPEMLALALDALEAERRGPPEHPSTTGVAPGTPPAAAEPFRAE